MIKSEYKYSDLTAKIIGSSMKVHSALGNGFQEKIYQRALRIELARTGLSFKLEVPIPIYYDGYCVGNRRADFLVEEKIIVELKAVTKLENVHLAQTLNYLEAFRLEIGLLINFGNTKLEFKRLTKNVRPQ